MKRLVCVLLVAVAMSLMLTGCGEKNEVKTLLKDFEHSCQSLDMEEMANCLNPKVVKPLSSVLDLLGLESGDINKAIAEIVSFADDYTEEDLTQIYQSLKVEANDFSFNQEKDTCDVFAEVSYTLNGKKEADSTIIHCKNVDGEWYIFSIDG